MFLKTQAARGLEELVKPHERGEGALHTLFPLHEGLLAVQFAATAHYSNVRQSVDGELGVLGHPLVEDALPIGDMQVVIAGLISRHTELNVGS